MQYLCILLFHCTQQRSHLCTDFFPADTCVPVSGCHAAASYIRIGWYLGCDHCSGSDHIVHDTFLRVLATKEIRISVINIQQPESDIEQPEHSTAGIRHRYTIRLSNTDSCSHQKTGKKLFPIVVSYRLSYILTKL